MEELAKTKMLIEGLCKNISESKPEEIDIVKATWALWVLEERVEVLKHIKNPPFKQDSKDILTFQIKGTEWSLDLDLKKFSESITIIS